MSYAIATLSRFPEHLVGFCKAIREAGEEGKILVADDGLPQELDLSRWGPIERFPCPRPFIFSRNANIVIQAAGTDDVFLANDDSRLHPRPMRALRNLEETSKTEDIGIVSAAVIGAVGNDEQKVIAGREGVHDLGGEIVCFVAVYLSRRVLDKVGPLDEQFDGYGFEDYDYTLRCKSAGLRNVVDQRCLVRHLTPSSSYHRIWKETKFGEHERSKVKFRAKWPGAKTP